MERGIPITGNEPLPQGAFVTREATGHLGIDWFPRSVSLYQKTVSERYWLWGGALGWLSRSVIGYSWVSITFPITLTGSYGACAAKAKEFYYDKGSSRDSTADLFKPSGCG